jgi:outer membrane protein assembly factor BamB
VETKKELERISSQYLFDKYRTGRMNFAIKSKDIPRLSWRFRMRSNPPKGPESTPVFDSKGNIYFGSHDGCIYSLNYQGKLRWQFKTDMKVYASPTIVNDENVIISGGDGYLYNFLTDGSVNWIYDISKGYRRKSKEVVFNRIKTIFKTVDFHRRRLWSIKSWSSPNVSKDGIVYVSGYGTGLHAINIENGEAIWTYDLGSPRFHLTGVCLDDKENIYACSQREYLHCLDIDGKLKWKSKLNPKYDIWGNPTYDPENKVIYVSASRREKDAIVYAIDTDGNIIWNVKIKGAIRGAATISQEDYIVICDFKGYVYFLSKQDGHVIYKNKFSSAQRALWTTASIDSEGNILFTTKVSNTKGSLVCLDKRGNVIWHHKEIGKALSTPVIDAEGKIYIGSWNGEFLCLQT